MKIAIVSTHPIQYHVPWFQKLAGEKQVDLKVYYALIPNEQQQGVGFGVAFSWDIPLLEGYKWEAIPNKRKSPSLTGFFSSSAPAIYSLLEKERPDVVIITGWQSLPLLEALWASMRLGIPRIVRGESNALRKRAWLARPLHRALLSRFDAFLAIGNANRDFYRQYGIAPERIFAAGYFVDNRRFEAQHREVRDKRIHIRASWSIPEQHTCYLFAGKLEPKKRIIDLLEALDRARQVNPALHLLVAGTGQLMREAQEMVKRRSLPVSFAGFLNQTEITRAYAAADCLVLPSDFGETWGLVVNEAMACGLPAIVSDRVGCGPDLIEENRTGSLFPCGDVSALAGKLVEMADTEKLARLGREAKERVSRYSVENAVAGTLRAVEFVINRKQKKAVIRALPDSQVEARSADQG
jgi:glycosyltransferase involved in cell wall biosynthesis